MDKFTLTLNTNELKLLQKLVEIAEPQTLTAQAILGSLKDRLRSANHDKPDYSPDQLILTGRELAKLLGWTVGRVYGLLRILEHYRLATIDHKRGREVVYRLPAHMKKLSERAEAWKNAPAPQLTTEVKIDELVTMLGYENPALANGLTLILRDLGCLEWRREGKRTLIYKVPVDFKDRVEALFKGDPE